MRVTSTQQSSSSQDARSPAQRRKVGTGRDQQNAPPPKRQFGHSTAKLHICTFTAESSAQTVASPSARRPLIAALPHSPPTPARSGHPVACHAARNHTPCRSDLRRVASSAPANSMALGAPPPAPSLLTPPNLHDHSQEALSALGARDG